MHRLLLSYGTGMVLCDGVSRTESMGQLADIWNIGLVGRSGVCFFAERMRTPWMISPDNGVLLLLLPLLLHIFFLCLFP